MGCLGIPLQTLSSPRLSKGEDKGEVCGLQTIKVHGKGYKLL